jgi:hypothetical protein
VPHLLPRDQLTLQEPFLGLFPPQKAVIDAITAAMKMHGFDRASPLRVWSIDGKLVVIDGHMRLQAATKAELEKVWVQEMAFPDVRAAMAWACQEQGERRRNLTKAEHRKYVVQAVRLLDRLQPKGGDYSSSVYKAEQKAIPLRKGIAHDSAQATARIVGTSASQVEAIRRVDRQGTEAQRKAITNGAGPQVIAKQLTPIKPSRSRKGAEARSFIAAWDGERTFVAKDDGHGVSPEGFEALYTLGGHVRSVHRGHQPGRYGVGFKEAAGWLWGITTIRSVHQGRRRELVIDWADEATKGLSTDMRIPVTNFPGRPGGPSVTAIVCEQIIRKAPAIETLHTLSQEFGHIYRPALEDGFRIHFQLGDLDLAIRPTPWPMKAADSPAVNRTITVAGREVHVRAYVTEMDQTYSGIHFACEGRAMDRLKTRHKSPRLYGWVTLGHEWQIGKNKTEITDRHRGVLMTEIERVCRAVLDAAARDQHALVLQELQLKVDDILRDGLAGILVVPETMNGPVPPPQGPPMIPRGPRIPVDEPREPSLPRRPPRIDNPLETTTEPDRAPKVTYLLTTAIRADQLVELDISTNRWTVQINKDSRFVRDFLEAPALGSRGVEGIDPMRLIHVMLDTIAAAAVHDERVFAAMPWLQGTASDLRYGLALKKLWDGILSRQQGPSSLFEPA